MNHYLLPVFLLISVLLSACSSSGSRSDSLTPESGQRPPEDARARMSDIKVGMSRSTVESILGLPMNVSEDLVGAPGAERVEVTVQYMPGMATLMRSAQQQMANAQTAGNVSGILDQGLGLAGLAGPAGGIAGGIGSSVLGMAGSLGGMAAQPSPEEMQAAMHMLVIRYRNDRVVGVQRMNPGESGMPSGGFPPPGDSQDDLEPLP